LSLVTRPLSLLKMPRWNSCNLLQIAPARRLWQFGAKAGSFVLNREHGGDSLPKGATAKSWSSLWQPKLNVVWLPPEHVFLRVIELPRSNFEETVAMVELQLEKLSPMPVAQIVWTIHILPPTIENLQTVVVVIAARNAVEEFLGKLEEQGFLADRLEAPILDQLETAQTAGDGTWVYPEAFGSKNDALVAWWNGGTLRNLSIMVLPSGSERTASLKNQLAQIAWAGELEGWLTTQPQWHLVADLTIAAEWENLLRDAVSEPVQVTQPLSPVELAAHTARRATAASERANLLPVEFSTRYHQQFVDRLWLHGLGAALVLYLIGIAIYFSATTVLSYQTQKVEQQVAALTDNYKQALQLKARYDVLKEREALKYAALDCWKLVAENLPDGISVERFSFANGEKLGLSGTVTPDQITLLTDHFYDPLRKAELNGQPMFDPDAGDELSYRQTGNKVSWNFSLVLKRSEKETP
jgi:hypothetical protein